MVLNKSVISLVLHADEYLSLIVKEHGIFAYPIIFLTIFCETGLVVTPFLPGDSLVFLAGSFASNGLLNVFVLFLIILIAAILGDSANYWIGYYIGEKFFVKAKFIKREHLERADNFYKKYGGKMIMVSRFLPIVRTLAPFTAGVSKMDYIKFLSFDIIGCTCWTSVFLFGGYFFGKIPLVQENILFASALVVVVILIMNYFARRFEN
ncbi:hypothetical protein FJZ53_05340 [Candidatus Woesearchaeota archaeon]|nr:hypothetical protein [Candidatus Woesearchaeota archaeon]